jgi:superfamily I DNA/RNA helicase
VPYDAAKRVFTSAATGAQAVLHAYVRLLASPASAEPTDVRTAFRVPNRYLPDERARDIARALRGGAGFEAAVSALPGLEAWRRKELVEGAQLLDTLLRLQDAASVVHSLRTEGGLDRHYSDQEQMSPHDQSEVETLDSAEADATGRSVAEYAAVLAADADLLERTRSEDGVELATIHGAKGREWPVVILFGMDESQLPHARTLAMAPKDDPGAAIEEERRLAYVALTRAERRLVVMYLADSPSRFLREAGIEPAASESERRPWGVGR